MTEPASALSAVCALTFVKLEIPPREPILAPWFHERDIVMVHAPRGCGKTMFGLSVALAVASGEAVMDWRPLKPRKVLLVDGEMSARTMQERIGKLMTAYGKSLAPEMLKLITPELQDRPIPDLGTPEGQDEIEHHLAGVELLILDNISTLFRSGVENDAESWASVQDWLLTLRRRGISVLLIHHSGKNGLQRGTSRREDILDVIIALRQPQEYKPSDGAKFDLKFEKARGLYGQDVDPRQMTLQQVDDALVWSWRSQTDTEAESVAEFLNQGLTIREVAKELSLSKSTVLRRKKKAIELGLIDG